MTNYCVIAQFEYFATFGNNKLTYCDKLLTIGGYLTVRFQSFKFVFMAPFYVVFTAVYYFIAHSTKHNF